MQTRPLMTGVTLGVLTLGMMISVSAARAEILKPPPRIQEQTGETKETPDANPVKSASPRSVGKPGDVPVKLTFSKFYDRDYVGGMQTHTAKYEDTMVQIARDYKMGFVELRAANPFLDPWIPGEGKKVTIPSLHLLPRAPREGLVINLADMRMYAYLKPGQAPKTYALGIGREGLLTPSGTTSIIAKKKDPVWRPTARMRRENPLLPAEVPAGPDNPLGAYALYLGWPEYRIHSTDKPYSIGRRASSGCIRMYPDEAEEGFKIFPNGIQVTVVNQSVKVGWVGEKLFLEATPTMEQADKMEVDGGLPGYVFPEEDMGIIVASAGEHAKDLDWQLIRQIIRERRGYPVEIFQKGAAPSVASAVEQEIVAEKTDAAKPVEKVAASAEGEKAVVEKTVAPAKKRITTPN